MKVTAVVGLIMRLSAYFSGVLAVQITELRVPPVLRNGTRESAVLDCEYSLGEEEKDGLLVRWFFNEEVSPVYQWIPHKEPQELGMLKGRLDLEYLASDDDYQRHRALRILRPTTQLTGQYHCIVSTFKDEDIRTATMIVFAPEKHLNLNKVKPTTNTVNVSCSAQGVYPEPSLELYKSSSSYTRSRVKGVKKHLRQHQGAYDVVLFAVEEDKELQTETFYECLLSIPGTNYVVRRSMIYSPGTWSLPERTENGASRLYLQSSAFCLTLMLLKECCRS